MKSYFTKKSLVQCILSLSIVPVSQAVELNRIPLPSKIQPADSDAPYVRGVSSWCGISGEGKDKTMVMNLQHGDAGFSDDNKPKDTFIFTYNFATGNTWFLLDKLYPYKYRHQKNHDLNRIIPEDILKTTHLRAVSTSHYDDLIAGFRYKWNHYDPFPGNSSANSNATYYSNKKWQTRPQFSNHQSTVLLELNKPGTDDHYLLMSNEVDDSGKNIYFGQPPSLELAVYSTKTNSNLKVNFHYNEDKAYFLKGIRDYENPLVFYANVCNRDIFDNVCTTSSSYTDRCEISGETVSCRSVDERGYFMTCPLQTSKGTKNLSIVIEDNQVKVQQPFAGDEVFPVQLGDLTGSVVPFHYPWLNNDQCDGAYIERFNQTLVIDRDPDNPDIVRGVRFLQFQDFFDFVKKNTGESLGGDGTFVGPVTKVEDHYEFLVFKTDGSAYYDELINVKLSPQERQELFSAAASLQ